MSDPGAGYSRRQFLHQAGTAVAAVGAASLLGAAAGCTNSTRTGASGSSTTTTRRRATTTTTTKARTGGGAVPWAKLASALTGTLVLPSNALYTTSKQGYNEHFDSINPAAIALCQSATDVEQCIRFARRYDVALTARSGGHSYAGYSLTTGLVVDISALNTVDVTSNGTQAVVGAGAKLIDVYTSLGSSGVLLPGGSCPTVGIAGLALGGGIGVFGRKYGLTCDNIESVSVVSANGAAMVGSVDEHPDLLWACQGGGGGNFGVVTSFTFSVQPIPDITLFTLVWPWSAAADVVGNWMSWMPDTPDELWSNCQLLSSGSAGNGAPFTVKVTGVYAGTTASCSAALQGLTQNVSSQTTDSFVGPEQYQRAMMIEGGCENDTVVQCHLTSQGGVLSRSAFDAKSIYITEALPSAGVDAVVNAVESLDTSDPSVGGGLVFDSYGGAINQVGSNETAFVHRNALACIQQSFSYSSSTPSSIVAAGQTWLTTTAASLAPFGSGAYQNYMDPTLTGWQQAYYGSNLQRLTEIKSAYDPDDFFHFAQSIPTRVNGG